MKVNPIGLIRSGKKDNCQPFNTYHISKIFKIISDVYFNIINNNITPEKHVINVISSFCQENNQKCL